jgi:hypothetical protein
MNKMLLVVLLIVAMAFAITPAFAEHNNLTGTAQASSFTGGAVVSMNSGSGLTGSLATQSSGNTSYAGFGTKVQGNVVTATTFGGSSGYTLGYAIHGVASGIQGGSYGATAQISIPKHKK